MLPESILVQPDQVGIPGDVFLDGQTFNRLGPRDPLLFAVDEDRHELPLSLAPRPPFGGGQFALRLGLLAFLLRLRHRIHPVRSRLVAMLRRRLAHSLDDARVGDRRDRFLDPVDLNVMKPVVAEVESVAEDTTRLQIQVVQLRLRGIAGPFPSSW